MDNKIRETILKESQRVCETLLNAGIRTDTGGTRCGGRDQMYKQTVWKPEYIL